MFRIPAAVVASIAAAAACLSACSSPPPPAGPITLSMSSPTVVKVTGLSAEEVKGLMDTSPSSHDPIDRVLRVRVKGADTAIAGSYFSYSSSSVSGQIEFHPHFPFDLGREYTIEFDQGAMPVHRAAGVISATVTLPAPHRTASTRVTGIHPSADTWPANLLRFYIHFSAPMGNDSGVAHVRLRDDAGKEVEAAFLPVEADLWSGDRTRYTVFFDPGRVKQGILPNRQMGRALVPGRRYVIEIDAAWTDANGVPLVSVFTREVRVGPPVEQPLSVESWKITPPAAGTRAPLDVIFPWLIDHALVQRALTITGPDGRTVAGTHELEPGDVRWLFTPADPWRAGDYRLTALPILEDPSGNQIGRAFEVDMKKAAPAPATVTLSRTFRIGT